jgi:membrane protein
MRGLTWKERREVVRDTFKGFVEENSFFHGAALSYYTIFALVPLLYLAFATFGRIVGNKRMLEIIGNLLKEQIGITDINGILSFLDGVDLAGGNFLMQVIGIIVLLISGTALFGSLRNSINEFYDIKPVIEGHKKVILSHLIARLVSISILTMIGVVIIVFYFAQTMLLSFGSYLLGDIDAIHWVYSFLFEHGLSIASNIIIFMFIFKFLNDGVLSWKVALNGSILTSFLLYFGQLLIKYYLTNYFFAADSGIAGTLLVILAWVYYSSQIIFFGAKYTSVYANKIGEPIRLRKGASN